MEMTMLGLSALVVGLVELVKRAGVPERVVPLCALGLGLAIAFVGKQYLGAQSTADVVLQGLFMGLSAMGLYSGGKAITEK